jgi:hypothetical protein
MGKNPVLQLASFWLSLALLLAGFHSVALAQVAVEYGIIGSKPPPTSPDTGKGISNKVQTGLKQTPSSDQGYKRQAERQSGAGGKTGGPLIIERRGDRYERVN